jgi:hypothetical protein
VVDAASRRAVSGGTLLMRLAAAEAALAHAATAVAALREIADLGPHASASLALGEGGR